MKDDFRFYSFVAGLYLSPLQCGLQTAHAVSEMYNNHRPYSGMNERMEKFDLWASENKTIVILNALNSKGVVDVHKALQPFASMYHLPLALFCEDADSLNGAPTATGIVLPKRYYEVEYIRPDASAPEGTIASKRRYTHEFFKKDGTLEGTATFVEGNPEFELIDIVKGFRLA